MVRLKRYLEKKGMRATYERGILAETALTMKEPFSSNDLKNKVSKLGANVSTSTILRNLKLFEDVGIIKPDHESDGRSLYQANPLPGKIIFICLECHKHVEYADDYINNLSVMFQDRYHIHFPGDGIRVHGWCATCSKKLGL